MSEEEIVLALLFVALYVVSIVNIAYHAGYSKGHARGYCHAQYDHDLLGGFWATADRETIQRRAR